MLKKYNLILWDNDRTVKKRGDDSVIELLPNIREFMTEFSNHNSIHIIVSGTADPDNEADAPYFHIPVAFSMFKKQMELLPVNVCLVSPAPFGTECWGILKTDKLSEECFHLYEEYQKYIGLFKKPKAGLLNVAIDLAQKVYQLESPSVLMIGDREDDLQAAKQAGVDFLYAQDIHNAFKLDFEILEQKIIY